MEFLQANWVWILLGLGAVWFLFRRGGMGCGMGGHGSHGSRPSERAGESGHSHASADGGGEAGSPGREVKAAAPRRHRGC